MVMPVGPVIVIMGVIVAMGIGRGAGGRRSRLRLFASRLGAAHYEAGVS
jgi:hypothetical protein